MKTYFVSLLIFIMLLFTVTVEAADVTLAWDANNPSENVTGYRIFARTSADYDYTSPIWQGNTTTATIQVDSQTAFVVRAYRIENITGDATESVDSNEVIWTPPNPESPTNLFIQAIDQLIQGLNTLKQAINQAG